MQDALDFLKNNKDVALATVSADALQQEIYNTTPVLQRLYADYRALTYFSMDIDHLDYFDLTPTPLVFRHYDKKTGMTQ